MSGSRNKSKIRCCLRVLCLAGALLGIALFCGSPAQADLDLADAPLSALVNSPPANIMVVIDDSKSMTCEVLMAGESKGFFPKFDETGEPITNSYYCYIYDGLDGNVYNEPGQEMDAANRKYWKSRHYADNVLYYNPNVTYEPWTSYDGQSFASANINNPKSDPLLTNASILSLDDVSFTVALKIDDTNETLLDVKNAHFFVNPDGDEPYLVTIDRNALNYYKVVEVDGTGLAQKIIKVESTGRLPQGTITNTVADHRQNFANWFAYHRRREYAAKASMAKMIAHLLGVRVGLLGITGNVLVPLKPVAAKINDQLLDETSLLLEKLYEYESTGGHTPLREGLNDVGRYYERNAIELVGYGGTTASGDSPPFFTEDEDGACQKCFAIVVADGYYTYPRGSGRIVSATDREIGNADGPDNETEFDRPALRDDLANTLADVAMYYYENDLQPETQDFSNPGLPDGVPSHGFDTAAHQHMVTYGVTFSVALPSINPKDYSINWIYNDSIYSVPWPETIPAASPQTITDLWHATLNSRGQFLTTQNPQQLSEALLEITESITTQLSGSAAAVSFNTTSLRADNKNDTYLFQSSFSNENDTEAWAGDVRAYLFDLGIGRFKTGSEPVWSAAEQLKSKSWDGRNIATYNTDDKTGKAFIYDNLTDEQKHALGWDEVSDSDAENTARDRVEYLKGREINGFRPRSSKLGDIIHSEPVHENDVIYVGANDGMLHAFSNKTFETNLSTNPAPGEELFAYIPNLVFENLAELTQPDYGHKFFVDLPPTIAKGMGLLEGKSPSEANGSQTLLVGGLGKGGKGYFALDITDPFAMNTAANVAQKVKWEFSDSDMGFSYSQPVVVRSYAADHPWVVMFGNGYGSSSGRAVFFIIDPAKKPGDSGFVAKRFDLTESESEPNGLSSPTPVDVNFDRVVDYVYVGDLHGNLWKFDLTADNTVDWEVSYHGESDVAPLFQAKGSITEDFPEGLPQPITTKPEITFHPSQHGYMVMFGTGKFLGESDFSDSSVQTVYGIWDYGDDSDDSEYLGAVQRNSNGEISRLSHVTANATLLRQEATDFEYTFRNVEPVDVRILSQNTAIWKTESDAGGNPNPSTSEDNHVGWYFDLATRERVVTDVALRDNKLLVIGFVPDPYRCEPGVGNSWFMEINAFNGGNLSMVQLDTTGGGTLNDHDLVQLNSTANLVPPAGIGYQGKLEKASILRIDNSVPLPTPTDDNGGLDQPGGNSSACGEQKYLSSSTGEIRTLCERSISLGMVYWQEVKRDD
jgi:type IV pilus assembly protein PilY1